jgi:iron-sulfur cluster assembly protein
MGVPRPKLKVMSLTDAAAARVKELMAKSDQPAAALRIGIKKGGCAGMEYTMDYAAEIKPGEDVVEEKGVRVVVDPGAVLFLLGTVMDYRVDKLSSGFVFDNPNQTSACGCGESVALTPARPDALAAQ